MSSEYRRTGYLLAIKNRVFQSAGAPTTDTDGEPGLPQSYRSRPDARDVWSDAHRSGHQGGSRCLRWHKACNGPTSRTAPCNLGPLSAEGDVQFLIARTGKASTSGEL